jgi:hypothetical protein
MSNKQLTTTTSTSTSVPGGLTIRNLNNTQNANVIGQSVSGQSITYAYSLANLIAISWRNKLVKRQMVESIEVSYLSAHSIYVPFYARGVTAVFGYDDKGDHVSCVGTPDHPGFFYWQRVRYVSLDDAYGVTQNQSLSERCLRHNLYLKGKNDARQKHRRTGRRAK